MSEMAATSVAQSHDVNLRQIVQDKILAKMVRHVTQLTHGWVVLVVDDFTTRILSYAVRMSDLTDCGVSIIERLELARQPFPEMNVIYFLEPTVANMCKLAQDFANPDKPKYADIYLYFVHHADDAVLEELKTMPEVLQRLKVLQEVHVDFLALEKCALSFDMASAFHQLYSPVKKGDEQLQLLTRISEKLVSVCATLEEYPFVRYKADQPRMQQLAQLFQQKMNEFVAKNDTFVYAMNRGTLLLVDRSQDALAPLLHESTFQAMVYDLLDVQEEQITYPAETNAGTVNKTAFLNENDKLWVEFRHTHIAKVSEEIGKRMAALSASSAGSSLGRGKSTDLHSMAAALRELPEYREMLGKLSQHLFLAGKAMEVFTKTSLLDASNAEQTMVTGVDDSGKKIKHTNLTKQLEDLFKDPRLTEEDRFRVVAVFILTQDMKEPDKKKIVQLANLPAKYDTAIENLRHLGGSAIYKQHSVSLLSSDEVKEAGKRATASEYSNARSDPKLKSLLEKALKKTLDEEEYPYVFAPPAQYNGATKEEAKKKVVPVSLRKKPVAKPGKPDISSDKDSFSGEKMLVFLAGGATYAELRSVYEVRTAEKRDIILGTTSFLKPKSFLQSLVSLHEAAPAPVPSSISGHGAEVVPLSNSDIHVHMETQLLTTKPSA